MVPDPHFLRLAIELLHGRPPEPAARLRKNLAEAYAREGLPSFDYRAAGFKRFKDYLLAWGEVLSLTTLPGGEMVVSLIGDKAQSALAPTGWRGKLPSVRSDVWIAFANPDPKRLRFYDATASRVVHFIADSANGGAPAAQRQLIRIQPVSVEDQSGWIRQFLEQEAPTRDPELWSFATRPYEPGINLNFAQALGDDGARWRHYRTAKMTGCIRKWAEDNSVPFAALLAETGYSTRSQGSAIIDVRQRVEKILAQFNDDELSNTVIPVLMAIGLMKASD